MKRRSVFERLSYSWSVDSIRLILTPGLEARSIYFYPQEIGHFRTNADYFTERENLYSFLIIYTLSGSGKLSYQNREFRLTPRSCCYINCMEHHEYRTASKEPWEFLWVHFNGVTALGYYKEFERNGFSVPVQAPDSHFFETTIQQLLSVNQDRNYASDPLSSALIHNLLTELLIQNGADSSGTLSVPEPIRNAARYIDKNFGENVSLDDLSRACGISKYHLSREFKKWHGKTIIEYLTETRLSYAKELLRYSDLSVESIAEACGIPNTSHFIRLFKTRECCTPLSYKKLWAT